MGEHYIWTHGHDELKEMRKWEFYLGNKAFFSFYNVFGRYKRRNGK